MTPIEQECRKALKCLYLEVHESIADDVSKKVLVALEEKDGLILKTEIQNETVFNRLVELYKTDYVSVAKICDEVLDRSGGLLGKIRDAQ